MQTKFAFLYTVKINEPLNFSHLTISICQKPSMYQIKLLDFMQERSLKMIFLKPIEYINSHHFFLTQLN